MDNIKLLTILLYIVQIFINIFLGKEIGPVANKYILDISPQNWVFSIWLVIYSFELIMLLNLPTKDITKIFLPFALTVLFNVSWIYSFTKLKLGLSVLFIIALLGTIIYIIINKKKYLNNIAKNFFNLYLGWVSIASFLGIFTWLLADYKIYIKLFVPFLIYTISIIKLFAFNLFTIIPYVVVYLSLLIKKKY